MKRKQAKPMLYLNVYDTNRQYGGPEEGGWWYDCGWPLSLLDQRKCGGGRTFFNDDKAAEAREAVEKDLIAFNKGRGSYGDINSVLCDGALRVFIETHPGRSFPERTPHYE